MVNLVRLDDEAAVGAHSLAVFLVGNEVAGTLRAGGRRLGPFAVRSLLFLLGYVRSVGRCVAHLTIEAPPPRENSETSGGGVLTRGTHAIFITISIAIRPISGLS